MRGSVHVALDTFHDCIVRAPSQAVKANDWRIVTAMHQINSQRVQGKRVEKGLVLLLLYDIEVLNGVLILAASPTASHQMPPFLNDKRKCR